jgi:GT2 family glycosyltransferase
VREPTAELESYDVVIVSHNHGDVLRACLASVAGQHVPPAKVVVADNASTDGSAGLAESWAERLDLAVFQNSSNIGFSAAVNRGLQACSSPWVLLLNPDCALQPSFAARLLASVHSTADAARVGSATGKLLRAHGPGLTTTTVVDAAGMIVTPSGRHLDRGAGQPDGGAYDREAWVFGGTAAATVYRRSALEDVTFPDRQVLPESFFAYREDAELAWRLQWRGWRCLYVPTAVGAHRRGLQPERGRRQAPEINAHSVKNRFLLRLHCADLGWHLSCFPWWLARDLLVVGACLTVERSSLPALRDVWRLRHDALSRRRHILQRRSVPSRQVRRWFRKRGWIEPVDAS